MMQFILDILYVAVAVAISPLVVYRIIRQRRYRSGWAQRFGNIARKDPSRKCIWIHAVSVGEVNATRTIVKKMESRFADFEIAISTTTDTGFARADALYGEKFTVFYFPLDISWIIKRAFRRLRPNICLLMELEVWPNFVKIAQKIGVPVVVVNGRLSESSFSKYKKIKPIAKKIFGKVSLVLAQTEQYAERFKELGCSKDKVLVVGSLKYDTAEITDKVKGAYKLAAQLGIDEERLWVTGATGNNEEKILLEVFKVLKKQEQFGDLRLVIVPRKPERFDEVAQLIQRAQLGFVRYSQIKDGTVKLPKDKPPVILGDTMGDLRKFYSLATIIFVGRSLVPMGGSDMAEAAALGKCTIFGPYAFNFNQIVDALLEGKGAIMVKDRNELLETMQKCLSQPDFARKIALNGQEVIRKNQGATKKTIDQIARFLKTE